MNDAFDVNESILATKADENTIAFAGFHTVIGADSIPVSHPGSHSDHDSGPGSDLDSSSESNSDVDSSASTVEGVLKIASAVRDNTHGYLTLTFIIDLEFNPDRRQHLRHRFARAESQELTKWLGPDFDYALEVPLDVFAHSQQFYMVEMNLYFHRLANRERTLLENAVIPALARLLGFQFDPLNWLQTQQTTPPPATRAASIWARLRQGKTR